MIPLGDGVFAEVDDVDLLPSLLHCNWTLSNKGYARDGDGNFLHWFIAKRMGLLITNTVDHIDRNRLNCRRSNLRLATQSEQQVNRNMLRNNTSGFTGVIWQPNRKKWQVRLQRNGKRVTVAFCTKLEDAVVARDLYLKRHGMELI